jgi:hypothetical protein
VLNEVKNAAKDKGLVTRYLEIISAIRSQAEMESARIKIIASTYNAFRGAGIVLQAGLLGVLNQRLHAVIQDAKNNAGPDTTQKYIAAAGAAQKMASIREQFGQAMLRVPAGQGGVNIYNHADPERGTVWSQVFLTPQQLESSNVVQREIALLDQSQREALVLTRQAAGGLVPTEDELQTAARDGLLQVEQAGEEGEKRVKNLIEGLKGRADKAYADGARQQSEHAQKLGEALQAVIKPAEDSEKAIKAIPGSYVYHFANILRKIDYQAAEEAATTPNLNIDQRIQKRAKVLTQAKDVIIQLAGMVEKTANATRTYKLAELGNAKAANDAAYAEANKLLNVFANARAAVKGTCGDLMAEIIAGLDASTQIGEKATAIQGVIDSLTTQMKGDLKKLNIEEKQQDQAVKRSVTFVLDKMKQAQEDAKATTPTLTDRDLTAIAVAKGMEIIPQARVDAIYAEHVLDNLFEAQSREIKSSGASPVLKNVDGTSLDLIKEYDLYERYASAPPDTLAPEERSEYLAKQSYLKSIENHIDNATNDDGSLPASPSVLSQSAQSEKGVSSFTT